MCPVRAGWCGLLASVAMLVAADRVRAVAPQIKDEAKLFSPEAVKKADEVIRSIAEKHEKDFLIETYPTVAGGETERVKSMSKEDRKKFFQSWAKERVHATAVNGIYLLVCKDPPYFQIDITPRMRSRFDDSAGQKLIQILGKQFQAKKYDEGLEQAVQFVRERLGGGDLEGPGTSK